MLVTLALVFLQIRRCPDTKRRWWNPPRWVLLGFLYGLVIVAGLDPEAFHRPLDLFRVNLQNSWLPDLDLRRADLGKANLQGVNLGALSSFSYLRTCVIALLSMYVQTSL